MIYATRLNPKQRQLLAQYEARTGFELLHQDDLDAGKMTFQEVWSCNVEFLWDLHGEITNLDTRGTGV